MVEKWLVIVNPMAGGGLAKEKWPEITEAFQLANFPYEERWTEYPFHAVSLVLEGLSKGFRKFVAVGGDGTIHEVINGCCLQTSIPSSEITVGVIPMGSGMDWARMYRIPQDVKGATANLLGGKSVLQDIGKVTFRQDGKEDSRFFMNITGMGFDAIVVQETRQKSKRGFVGKFVYLLGLLKSMGTYDGQEMIVKGAHFEKKGWFLSANVGLCQYSGGGMRMVPLAIPDDGEFDITVIEDLKAVQIIANLPKLYNGTIYRHQKVSHFRSSEVYIHGELPVLIEADGELLGHSPANFTILPKAIKVIVPAEYLD